ncbi:Eco57I restriction-modification methylase domain-containing protein [Xylella fastidiosa]|uniref:Eco57I restriction-modification methylase domain-containing protein n=1 Tax=Xylella fastidiosa TaxID=2371 RepID=UPI000FEC9244|nr:DEAD/DEAH box helicase family protein [Xylella fastidiosa]MRU28312.1 helicase [Xylella fastidiosa subsp. multiplex]MRU30702.1 helicase [Xylella fastidiosa subsp. multiplex]
MAKKRKTTDYDSNQSSFDFVFNKTTSIIDSLQIQINIDEDKGAQHAYPANSAADNRDKNSQADNDTGGQTFPIVSPAWLENPRPLGVQQPGEIAFAGIAGRGDSAGQTARAADNRAPSPEQVDRFDAIWTDGTRDSDEQRDQHRVVTPVDYVITSQDQLGEGGAKAKYRDNIAALKLLMELRKQARGATQDEQAILVRYVGWGGLQQAFDHRNQDWNDQYLELAGLLTKNEYDSVRRSTQDAHYTSEIIIDGIYKGLQRIGFNGGSVFEPSAGIGNFIGLMPTPMRSASHFTAIELDPLTAEIARHLYPSATHINRGLQEVMIPSGYFDACVGNPPFGTQSLYDSNHRELGGFSIHNYFLAKSIDKLREGGVMAFVVSHYFLDTENTKARAHIADNAHFLGAIRLPNTAFKRNALTEVTTDIVFFQKAAVNEIPDRRWVDVGAIRDHETGNAITLNRYFVDHPEQMLGRMAITNKMYRDTTDLLPEAGTDLAAAIEQRLQALPANVYRPAVDVADVIDERQDKPTLTLQETLKIGSFFTVPNGRLARRLPDVLNKHDYAYVEPKNGRVGARIKGMVQMREALRDLMLAEQSEHITDLALTVKRTTLNRIYDDFVSKFGYVSSQANRLVMSEDPEYPLLQALESNYDKGISTETAQKHNVEPRRPSANKAAIFSKRVMNPRKQVTHVETAKEALLVSIKESGRIDIASMMRLMGKPEEEIIRDLKGLIYLNPQHDRWETANQYLSGNVKEKLRTAETAAEKNPRYIENVDALRAVQPADIEPVDISIQLGSTWVPEQVIDQFVVHLLGNVPRRITYQEALGKWFVDIGKGDLTTAHITWGIEAYPANELIKSILINRPIQIKVEAGKDPNGNKIYRVDDAQTAAANQKADEIRQEFLSWVWEDKDRREMLSRIYNDRFNTNIPAKYDGSHLDLHGASLDITLLPHQKDAIWRGIQNGTALFDHVVGAGKTLVCVGTIMESKRIGLMSKPMLVVPNHLLLQWKDAFYSLYPNANILVAEKNDFKKQNREHLFSRIAVGDWDAVIIAHSSFKKIGMPEDTLHEMLNEQINDLNKAINQIKRQKGDRITVKEMEKAKERMLEKLKLKADNDAKDKAVSFADLGVDSLFVDEAHEFKNLFINTTLNRVSGLGNLAGSDKAFDMFVKCRYLQQRNDGRGVFFATGTPISNTIAEIYTMQRYLQYDDLKARGILHFDAWASTFGQVVTGWELDATGVNYRLNSRFSKFQNVPELISLYRTFADVITKSDLDRQAEERGTRFPVPKIKGGRPQNIIVERSEAQALFMGVQTPVLDHNGQAVMRGDGMPLKDWNSDSIIYRMENLPRDPRLDNPLKITNDARKVGLDFRLINPQAPDDVGSKINTAIEKIYCIWEAWKDRRGTQLVFCDLSTPKLLKKAAPIEPENGDEESDDEASSISMDELLASNTDFSVYDDIKTKLIARGVPEHEIRFIHEATTDLQKAKLFDDMNRGYSRIMLGSTAKMGAGTNVQQRLVAEHHLDAPWRPSDLEQREGRILRQGNLFYEEDPDGFEVEILRYATKQTYDSCMWQTIEYKAAGIEQFRKGDILQRVIEDVASEAANAAEMKAAATGNPLIFMQVQLSADLKKLEALFSNYKRNQYSLESQIVWLGDANKRADRAVARWNREIEIRDTATTEQFRFETKSRVYGEKDRENLMGEVMHAMKKAIDQYAVGTLNTEIPVGNYRGFDINVYASRDKIQFTLNGSETYEPENLSYNAQQKFNITGFIHRLDNFMVRFEEWRQKAQETREKEHCELAKVVVEKDKPFPQQARLEALRQDVREVMTELKLMLADENYVSQWQPQSQATDGNTDQQQDRFPNRVASKSIQ